MVYRNNEDIFTDEPIKLVIRFENKSIRNFDKQNRERFEELKRWIENRTIECFFQKKNEDEHKVVFHIENKQIEFFLKWQEQTFDYKTIINQKSNNIVNDIQPITADEYTIVENCIISLIGFKDSNFPNKELIDLYNRVCNLDISPKSEIENQQEVWDKWIEAQKLILNKNSKPLEIVRYDHPINIHESLYQFRVTLKQDDNPEYKSLENIISKELFNINEKINPDGSLLLRFRDIEDVLDRVIKKDFSDILERNNQIGCVLQITPHSISNKISKSFNNRFLVTNNSDTINVYINKLSQKSEVIDKMFLEEFYLNNYGAEFEINWPKNIKLDNQIKLTDNQLAKLSQNTFYYSSRDLNILKSRYNELCKTFNKKNVKTRIYLNFRSSALKNIKISSSSKFSNEFWNKIKRECYFLDFDINISESQKTIAFDFTNFKELNERFSKVKNLGNYHIIKSPLDDDFKFKVKIDVIAKKSKKEEFLDKTKYLAGSEFYIDKGDEFEYRTRQVVIGNLNGRNSDYNHYVFNLPYKWQDDKQQTDKFFKFIEEEPKVKFVTPNLRGDQAKISWLNEAMNKITNPREGLDLKPVNEKIKDFIFDSSKAEEIYRNLSKEEEWNELKKHELLILNDSQRKAVLSALNCTDLALLQGPPGTGKTTVIAEMIWQMVRVKQEQKILLTSETNLAVDNALEKLLNKNHTLVKPIRFGRASKFDEEGKKYAFERIMKWVDEKFETDDSYVNEVLEEEDLKIVEEDFYNNSVQLWMRRIANNSQQSNPKYSDIMKNWAFEMAQPDKEMKTLFKDKYFKYANVVGSTSSSAGSPNFGADYQRIFNLENQQGDNEIGKDYKYIKKKLKTQGFEKTNIANRILNYIKPIEFDTVITDEASKATPPELLLPMCFGQKNIIIGDHRQLPPMLHDKTFKETLESLETKEAKELASEINKDFVETSQFERLIMHPKVSPTIKSTFNEQYRMHPKINNVIKQFYLDEGGLEPGKPIKENADDINISNPFSRHHGFLLNNFIHPAIHTIWVDVDEPEELSGTSRINKCEVEAVELVIKLLKKSNGFKEYMKHWENSNDQNKVQEEQEIGLISFYGHQVSKLKEVALKARNKYDIPVRLNTVDKFQGMERNIIIASTVRSDRKIENGVTMKNRDIGFAKSPKRLNVALSRAKRLLIVVGNKNMFYRFKDKFGNQIYKNVIDTIKNEGFILDFKELKKEFGNDK